MARFAAWLLGSALLSGAACGEDDRRTVRVPKGCLDADICAITETACQKAILAFTACVRGDFPAELPPIRMLSREELAVELNMRNEEDTGPSEALRAMEMAFAALHLIAPETDLNDAVTAERAASIAAYYRADTADITIVSDAVMEPEAAVNTLSHELTHYLQDLTGQLGPLTQSDVSLDQNIAGRALIEGDAVVTSNRVNLALRGYTPRDADWDSYWDELQQKVVDETEASASPLVTASRLLPYVISPPVLHDAWERGGRDEVDEIYASPPLTQLDWLDGHPARSRTGQLRCFPPPPPDGYAVIAADTLGIAGMLALSSALDRDLTAFETADAWRQDRLAIYVRGAAADLEVLAAWRIRFESASSAADFESALEPLGLDIERWNEELLIRVSGGAEDPSKLSIASCLSREQFAAVPRRLPEDQASLRAMLMRSHAPMPELSRTRQLLAQE